MEMNVFFQNVIIIRYNNTKLLKSSQKLFKNCSESLKLLKSCRAQSIQTERKVAHHEGKKGRKTTCQKHTILLRINKFRPDTNLIFVLVLSPIECNIIPRGHQQPRGLKQRMVHPCSPDFWCCPLKESRINGLAVPHCSSSGCVYIAPERSN